MTLYRRVSGRGGLSLDMSSQSTACFGQVAGRLMANRAVPAKIPATLAIPEMNKEESQLLVSVEHHFKASWLLAHGSGAITT